MSNDTHPQVAGALKLLEQFNSVLSDQMHRSQVATFYGTDEASSVGVTLDGRRTLTGLFVEEGLLRLGAKTVQERINEALANAQVAASATIQAQQQQLASSLADIADSLKTSLSEF